jgi:hypothetical protein
VTFDHAAVAQESTKYAWYADRLGRPAVADRIRQRRTAAARPTGVESAPTRPSQRGATRRREV